MELLGWILLGLVVGAAARFVLPRNAASGTALLILLGIAGAMLAGFLGRALQLYDRASPASFASAALGAVTLILLYRLVLRARPTT